MSTNSDIRRELFAAIDTVNLAKFRSLLSAHPEQLSEEAGSFWLKTAAGDGLLEFVQVLVEAGCEMNVGTVQQDHTPIMHAAMHGHLPVVQCLLDHGAKVNFPFDNNRWSSPALSTAAGEGFLEIVKLLVEHGADINATAPNGITPLMAAKMGGTEQVAEYLYSIGARDIRELTPPDFEASHKRLKEIMQQQRGEVRELRLPAPQDSAIRLCCTTPSPSDDSQTIFTIGLGDRNLSLPNGRVITTELALRLPPDWPLDNDALSDEQWAWPIAALRTIAETAVRTEQWPGDEAALLMNGEPPAPFTPSTKLCGWVALAASGSQFQMPDFRWVEIRDLVGIYQAEKGLIEELSHEEFVRRLHAAGTPLSLDLKRPNIADEE
ncbi:MAG TPA: ankyrin repeat domain-containing protein [Pirellulaceae bacterium]|nr:ankyrin repeat domain-containing protein [Pirellulaceae bacterium]